MKAYIVIEMWDIGDDIISNIISVYKSRSDAEKCVSDAKKERENNEKIFKEKYPTADEYGFFDDNDSTLENMTKEEHDEWDELRDKVYPFDDFKGYSIREYELK